jgi:hypothetical protein
MARTFDVPSPFPPKKGWEKGCEEGAKLKKQNFVLKSMFQQ